MCSNTAKFVKRHKMETRKPSRHDCFMYFFDTEEWKPVYRRTKRKKVASDE